MKGEPFRYLRGHAPREVNHRLTGIDERLRTATCSRCGDGVLVKRDGDRWKCTGDVTRSHVLIEIDIESRTAHCRRCGQRVDIVRSGGGQAWGCGIARREWANAYSAANRDVIRTKHEAWRDKNINRLRAKAREKKYGLTPNQFAELLASQNGQCAICKRVPPIGDSKRKQTLHVDHSHITGEVRALLCDDCNRGIGMFAEDPDRLRAAIEYLTVHLAPPSV